MKIHKHAVVANYLVDNVCWKWMLLNYKLCKRLDMIVNLGL